MSVAARLNYYRRVSSAYLLPGKSQLTFWHDQAQVNPGRLSRPARGILHALPREGGLRWTATMPTEFRCSTITAILACNTTRLRSRSGDWETSIFFFARKDPERKRKSMAAADWLVKHLEPNAFGVPVWNHMFDWEYRTPLKAPWYSGLAQGQGISLLVRTGRETGKSEYLEAASRAFDSFSKSTQEGGVVFTDERGDIWFEEYIVSPPTHILNGFIWAAWGVYDFFLATGEKSAEQLFARAVNTLRRNLDGYDLGFWSLYEQSGTRLPMVASPFYHQLHVAQLRMMHRLTGDDLFSQYADRWETYARSRTKRTRALCYKGAFKLCYY